jgi:putative addiction module component (TIGR02574 family)
MAIGFFFCMGGDVMEYQAVLDAARALPVEERVRLVDQIHDDLQATDPNLTPELMQELERRLADIKANPGDGVTWEEVMAEARARHKA